MNSSAETESAFKTHYNSDFNPFLTGFAYQRGVSTPRVTGYAIIYMATLTWVLQKYYEFLKLKPRK